MESEVVRKRQWMTQQQFLDLLGAANLIPGPTSTEMAISTGFVRAGWSGLSLAGVCFIVPAALSTGAFAWAYVRFGSMPQAVSVLAGIKPAVIAVIAIAIWRLGKAAVRGWMLAALGLVALTAFFLNFNPLAILLGGGLLGMIVLRAGSLRMAGILVPFTSWLSGWSGNLHMWTAAALGTAAVGPTAANRPSLIRIGLFFLKLGAVLYGGGYVLLAFLEQDLVHQNGWLTHQQLLDAIAIGQFTPGPVFSTATFIGYLLGGSWGAVVATVGIFLPSFFYVALLAPVLFRLRQSPWMAAFLDSVNACAIALMVGVTVKLAADALRGWPAWMISATALVVLLKWKINTAWVILGGALLGLGLAKLQ
jgi:chromate transporter